MSEATPTPSNSKFVAKETYFYRNMCNMLMVLALFVAFGGGVQMLSAYQYEQINSLYPKIAVIYPILWETTVLVIGLFILSMFGLLLVNLWESSQQNAQLTHELIQVIAKRSKPAPPK